MQQTSHRKLEIAQGVQSKWQLRSPKEYFQKHMRFWIKKKKNHRKINHVTKSSEIAFSKSLLQKYNLRAGGMAQWWRALAGCSCRGPEFKSRYSHDYGADTCRQNSRKHKSSFFFFLRQGLGSLGWPALNSEIFLPLSEITDIATMPYWGLFFF